MKKINWKDHLIGFVVVVLGILIAFQLNNYSVSVRQQKIMRNHFKYIKDETEGNKLNLKIAIERSERVLGKIDTMLFKLRNKEDIEYINAQMFQILDYNNVYFRKNAYLALIESGDVRWIKDYELKTETINLYEYFLWTKAIETNATNTLTESYFPYISKNMDFVGGKIQDKSIYFNKEFSNYISTIRYTLSAKVRKYKDCLQQMDIYLKLLEDNDF
ncbi:MAG: hypothetical protein AAFQ94_13600 [Bacteroidota bacterium]